jgi:hypothetical protein
MRVVSDNLRAAHPDGNRLHEITVLLSRPQGSHREPEQRLSPVPHPDDVPVYSLPEM